MQIVERAVIVALIVLDDRVSYSIDTIDWNSSHGLISKSVSFDVLHEKDYQPGCLLPCGTVCGFETARNRCSCLAKLDVV